MFDLKTITNVVIGVVLSAVLFYVVNKFVLKGSLSFYEESFDEE